MSLYGVLRTGASGMTAQSNKLSTIGDNIANADTAGYKKTSTQFSALLLQNTGTNYNSGSVETTIRTSVSEEGPTTYTTSKSDLAIGGKGFFVVSNGDGANYLTRAGNFVKDAGTGNYNNASGYTLMGYPLGTTGTVNGFTGLEPVNLSAFNMVATPTTDGTFSTNLPLDAAVGDAFTSSVKVVNNAGGEVIVNFTYTKTAANSWNLTTTPPGGAPTALTFDPSTFQLLTPAAGTVNVDLTGQTPPGRNIAFDISSITQFDAEYTPEAFANGNKPSAVAEVEFAADGTVYAVYEDGSKLAAFRVPLANVASPDNLEQLSGGVFATTTGSGEVQMGTAGLGGLGTIAAGVLEQSNVDLASELTEMIVSQRSYTANSKVFQTGSELLEVLMNLKR